MLTKWQRNALRMTPILFACRDDSIMHLVIEEESMAGRDCVNWGVSVGMERCSTAAEREPKTSRWEEYREWISTESDVWSTSANPPFFRNENATGRTPRPFLFSFTAFMLFSPFLRLPSTAPAFFSRVISMHNDSAEQSPLPNLS